MPRKYVKNLCLAGLLGLIGQTAYAQMEGGANNQEDGLVDSESFAAGVRIGTVNVDSLTDNVWSYGGFVDYGLSNQLSVGGSLDFWSDTSGILAENPAEVRSFTLGAHSRWVFTNFDLPVRPYGLAGLAVHRIRIALSERTDEEIAIARFREVYSDSEVRVGIDLAGGVLFAVDDNVDVIGEIRYRNLLDDKIGFDQWAFSAALAYRF